MRKETVPPIAEASYGGTMTQRKKKHV